MYVSGLNHFEQPLAWDCQRAIRSPVVPALSRDSTYHLARYQTNEAAYLINNNGIILLVGMMMMSQEWKEKRNEMDSWWETKFCPSMARWVCAFLCDCYTQVGLLYPPVCQQPLDTEHALLFHTHTHTLVSLSTHASIIIWVFCWTCHPLSQYYYDVYYALLTVTPSASVRALSTWPTACLRHLCLRQRLLSMSSCCGKRRIPKKWDEEPPPPPPLKKALGSYLHKCLTRLGSIIHLPPFVVKKAWSRS